MSAAASRSSALSPAGTGDLGGGGGGFLAADQVHLLVGEAVEFDEHFGGAGNGGEGGGFELALEDLVHALWTLLSMALRRRSGMRLSARAAAGRGLAAARAPLPCFVGGGVGDTVAVQVGLAQSLAGLSIFSQTVAGCLWHFHAPLFGRQARRTGAPGRAAVVACGGDTCWAARQLPVFCRQETVSGRLGWFSTCERGLAGSTAELQRGLVSSL